MDEQMNEWMKRSLNKGLLGRWTADVATKRVEVTEVHKHARKGKIKKMTMRLVKQHGRWRRSKKWRRRRRWRPRMHGGGGTFRHSYLALAIVPPGPLVTQTNKTARTYHRGAVSDLGLDTAVFFKLYEIVEGIPRPRAAERGTEVRAPRQRNLSHQQQMFAE